MTHPHVGIVGGGLAGLAAAVDCVDAGAAVTVYEARSRLGGATFSFERNGLWLDNGEHVALRCCTEYLDFLRRLGVASSIPLQKRLDIPVLREGRTPARLARAPLPAPFHLAWTLLRYAPLTPAERLSAAWTARALGRLDPDDPAVDRQCFGDWLAARRQSPNAIEGLWDMIAVPTLNLPASEASLAAAVKVFRTALLDSASGGDIAVPNVPFEQLHARPAASAIEAGGGTIRMKTAVQQVSTGLDVTLATATERTDAVIVALPPEGAAAILPADVAPIDVERLGASPIVNIHLHFDRVVLTSPIAAAVGSPIQWIFDRTSAAGATEGQVIAISLSHAVDAIGRSTADLRAHYLPALERLLPAARDAKVIDFAATHEPRATFRVAPGVRAARPGAETSVPGLFLAGAWTDTGWPATMEGAVRSGRTAARLALSTVGLSPRTSSN